jgi:hypothetical protein
MGGFVLKGIVATVSVAVIVGLIVSGCGSDSQTKEAFVQEANSICAQAKKQKQAITNKAFKALPAGSQGTKKQAEQLFAVLLRITLNSVGEIEELTPPNGEEAKVEELTAAMRAASKTAEEKTWAVLRNKYIAYGDVNKMVRKYGMKECAV